MKHYQFLLIRRKSIVNEQYRNIDNNIYYMQSNCTVRVCDDHHHETHLNKSDNGVELPFPKSAWEVK